MWVRVLLWIFIVTVAFLDIFLVVDLLNNLCMTPSHWLWVLLRSLNLHFLVYVQSSWTLTWSLNWSVTVIILATMNTINILITFIAILHWLMIIIHLTCIMKLLRFILMLLKLWLMTELSCGSFWWWRILLFTLRNYLDLNVFIFLLLMMRWLLVLLSLLMLLILLPLYTPF